jgi:histone deacetylase 11
MYALIDAVLWCWSVFMIINGIHISAGHSSYIGLDSAVFWLTFGILFFLLYPFLLEILLWVAANLESPSPPDLSNQIAIAYHPSYNITAGGIEKCHPFDSQKYGKVFNALLLPGKYIVPSKCPRALLIAVHPFFFLLSLCYSLQVFRAVEVPVCFLPGPILRWRVLNPMLYATYGSILAGCAAVNNKKYGINLSGGYHHASSTSCGGFCIYADITLTVHWLRKWYPSQVRKVMIVDLDAHQGNGHETDFLGDSDVFIIDFYNDSIYPGDYSAKEAIRYQENFDWHNGDEEYLDKLENALSICIKQFAPDFIVYNAGTDCMEGDPLGSMSISAEGIVERDEKVFRHATENRIPVLMLLSGGYQQQNAPTIARSIANLNAKFRLYS